MTNLSPMMRQYFEIKKQYKDYILFFRLGDFYEMFFDDAKIVSKELELTLTGRDCGQKERAPMCGVPYHSHESYVNRLINKGFKVAICEQMSDPKETKGIVQREVVRVITPGTLIDSNMLSDEQNNFIASVFADEKNNSFGVCFCDVSTGEVFITDINNQISNPADNKITNKTGNKNKDNNKNVERKLINELSSFSPAEILTNSNFSNFEIIKKFIKTKLSCLINIVHDEDLNLDFEKSEKIILKYFKKESLSQLGFSKNNLSSVKSLAILINYLIFTHKSDINNISCLNFYLDSQYMALDISAKKNLEITENLKSQDKKKSLLGVLDKTKTPMGKRMIRKYLEQPLLNTAMINKRLDAVEELVSSSLLRMSLTETFAGIFDIERLLTKIIFKTILPRELQSFKYTLGNLPKIKELLASCHSDLLFKLNQEIDVLSDIYKLIDEALVESPPALLKDGEVIKDGFNFQIDEYRDILKNSKNYISKIEEQEKNKTGIKTLKIRYNKVFGYYIEISKSAAQSAPEHYIRKQTLANCERYIIEELKEIEYKILEASTKAISLETKIYDKIIESVADNILRIHKTATAISNIDVLCSLANVSVKNNYCKPIVDNSDIIKIENGRHPIVESMLTSTPFVSNSTEIVPESNKVSIITGPNMSGKSTYMRQVALIVIMAQMGCFVPATSAHIGVVDGIFTRIGASDDLSSGQSTFMVEMTEIAYILKNMTSKSLVILDEIGRGTSTYDGMSIAEAIAQHIALDQSGGKTLFATHYHELAKLPEKFSNIKNYSICVKKNGDDITFLHRIVPTSADKSYGLEVSKLAGVPEKIIAKAKEILFELESQKNNLTNLNSNHCAPDDSVVTSNSAEFEKSQKSNKSNLIISELEKIDPEVLSPLEALNQIYKFKKIISE